MRHQDMTLPFPLLQGVCEVVTCCDLQQASGTITTAGFLVACIHKESLDYVSPWQSFAGLLHTRPLQCRTD